MPPVRERVHRYNNSTYVEILAEDEYKVYPGHLPELIDHLSPSQANLRPSKKSGVKSFIKKETIDEFRIRKEDLPQTSKKDQDHIDQNIRLSEKFNEINKVLYLSKLKMNIENQQKSTQRHRY